MTVTHLDGTPMSAEEFESYCRHHVSVMQVNDPVMLTRDDGQSSQGTLSYTEGLKPKFGYELVAFGAFDPEDLIASAMLIAANFPRGFPVHIPYQLLAELEENIPNVGYKQYVVDESALESDTEEVSDQPLWVADGGFPILTDAELQRDLTSALAKQTQERHDRMEEVRERYRQMINDHQFTVVAVFDPEGKDPPFFYTVGLTRKQLPELIVSGRLDSDFLHRVLNHFGYQAIEEGFTLRKLEDFFTLTDDSKYDVRLVELDPVHAKDRYLIQAEAILKEQVTRVVQIQFSDENKLFPGDVEFNNKFEQPEIAPVIAGGSRGVLEA